MWAIYSNLKQILKMMLNGVDGDSYKVAAMNKDMCMNNCLSNAYLLTYCFVIIW